MERGERELLMGMSHLGIRVLCVGYFFPKVFFTKLHPSSHPPPKLANARGGGKFSFVSKRGEGKSLRRHLAPQPPKYKHNLGFLALASPAVTRREKSGKERKNNRVLRRHSMVSQLSEGVEEGRKGEKTFGVNFPTEQKRTKTQEKN